MAKENFENWTKGELIKEIDKLRKRKKYGIVWEEKAEKVADLCKEKLPVLEEDKTKGIKTEEKEPMNVLIEGDNYHALSVLNYTHKGKIDVIYIDPPYNTGSTTWTYNNKYVDTEDAFKHSKWISFMYKRTKLAKNLLNTKGILICAVDDYECHNLRHVLDEIFGEDNRLGTIVVIHNPRGRSDDKFFATSHEYLLVYAKNKKLAEVGTFKLSEEDKLQYNKKDDISPYNVTSYMRTGNNSNRTDRPGLFYPIYYNEKTDTLSLEPSKDSIKMLPINNHGDEKTWRWGKKTFDEKNETELFVRKVKGQWRIFKKRRLTGAYKKPKTIWHEPKYDASSNGIMILRQILGRGDHFSYPKSLYAVKDILALTSKRNSIILDFFAGSGTTGHAVLELNREDQGKRGFILCTNNENDICSDVCYPRIKKVIKGYTDLRGQMRFGIGGNLRYFKTDFVDAEPTDLNKKKLVDKSTEMLCLKENCFSSLKKGKKFQIFKNEEGKHLGIVYDDDGIDPFKNEVKKLNKKFVVYVFSLDESAREEEFEDISDLVKLKPIPAVILNVYKRIFR